MRKRRATNEEAPFLSRYFFRDDCLHVALATVHRADVLVSWNFRHIVRFDRIRGFNAVNLREGYGTLDIRSPMEVMIDET